MPLPRLRPLPRVSLDWLGGGGRLMLLYVVYTAVLFVTFLLLTFPHEMVIRRALSAVNRGPVTLQFNTATFAWHRGYRLSGIRVAADTADDRLPYLECSNLWVRPALDALLRGNPYALLLSADLYGGEAWGQLNIGDGGVGGAVVVRSASLGHYGLLTSLLEEGQLSGRVSGEFSFEARGPNLTAGQGAGEIALEGASLEAARVAGFGSVPDLHFHHTKARFTVRNGRLEVQDLTAAGEELNVQASGQIVLRDPVQDSVLNLRVTLQPGPAPSDAIKGLLAIIPRPPGGKPDAPMTVTGTLARPRAR